MTDMGDILVSIIMPCWNSGLHIVETIESVLGQTWKNWELMAVDDGSSDNTLELLNGYAARCDKIHVFQGRHKGSAAARNIGIEKANGNCIAFLDSDDLWKPDYLEKQIAFMKKTGAACVSCNYSFIDSESRDIMKPTRGNGVIRLRNMMITNRIGMLTGMYDADKIGKTYFDESLRSLRDDYAYWIEIVKKAGTAQKNGEVLAKYRVYQNSTTGKKAKLIRVQYRFYHDYLKLNRLISLRNTFAWGVRGLAIYVFGRLQK